MYELKEEDIKSKRISQAKKNNKEKMIMMTTNIEEGAMRDR